MTATKEYLEWSTAHAFESELFHHLYRQHGAVIPPADRMRLLELQQESLRKMRLWLAAAKMRVGELGPEFFA